MKILIGLFCFIMMGVSGCNEEVAVREWIKKVDLLRTQVQGEINSTPYKMPQHQAFKNYFSEIQQMAVRLTQDRDFKAKFNKAIVKVDLGDACSKVFIVRNDWQTIINHCTKNGLFICSDEVQYYPDLVGGFRKQLAPDIQKKFDAAPACKDAL